MTSEHISGLWLGEAKPDEQFEDVVANPIEWSLTLKPTESYPSVFGAGFFDDSGDIPGQPILMYSLHGKWDRDTNDVHILKQYCSKAIPSSVQIKYFGKYSKTADGDHTITGTWLNEDSQITGVFACVRQD